MIDLLDCNLVSSLRDTNLAELREKLTVSQASGGKSPVRGQSQLMPREAYDSAADYYDEWPWQKFWHQNEWPLIREMLIASDPPKQVLDIGVGTGTYLGKVAEIFPEARLFGIDVSEGMLGRAHARLGSGVTLIRGNILEASLDHNSFDLILANRVASHIKSIKELTGVINQLLTLGGCAIISDVSPSHDYECTRLPVNNEKISVETFKHAIEEWESAVESAKLKIDEIKILDTDNLTNPEAYPREMGPSDLKNIGFIMRLVKK